jgi:hypothetical protein
MRAHNALIAAALAVTAGACGAQPKSEPSKPDSAVAPLAAIAQAVASDLGTASDSVMRKLGFGPADADAAKKIPTTPAAPTEVRRRTPRPNPAPAAVPAVVVPGPLAIEPSSIAVEEPPAEEPAEIVPVVYEPPVEVDSSIYTVADLDVAVPILRSHDLPRWRSSDRTDVDAVEVVVSQQGSVERIRLVSRPRRMIDMMALSAAKMWKFDPGLKNGAPVRYRLVLASPSTTYER